VIAGAVPEAKKADFIDIMGFFRGFEALNLPGYCAPNGLV
jgi:hypothetical protein